MPVSEHMQRGTSQSRQDVTGGRALQEERAHLARADSIRRHAAAAELACNCPEDHEPGWPSAELDMAQALRGALQGLGSPFLSSSSGIFVRLRALDVCVNAIFPFRCAASAPLRPMSSPDSRNKYAYTTIMDTVSSPVCPSQALTWRGLDAGSRSGCSVIPG